MAGRMGKMKRIICIGHSALDHIFRVESFPRGPSKVRALEHVETGGGMAANAAATIARLAGKAELWSRVGDDDAGAKVRAGLRAVGVDVRSLQSFEEGRTSTSAIIVDDAGERLIVGARDINMPSGTSWLPLERIRDAAAVLGDVRWLEALRVAFTRARREGVPTVLDGDLGAREAMSELLALTDYAIFSQPALDDFLPQGATEEKLRRVLELGPRHAGVTLGPEGYRWVDEQGPGHQPGFAVDVVDTTGAGDAFHGAFTLALVEGQPIADCARFACAVAAMKCTRIGSRAGLPTRAQVESFLAARS